MFDFSLAELLVVAMVMLVSFRPSEMLATLRWLQSVKMQFTRWWRGGNKQLAKWLQEDQVVDVIIDEKGNYQKVYDVEALKPPPRPQDE